MDSMRRTILLLACAGAFCASLPAMVPVESAAAEAAPERVRDGYNRWRHLLQRHGLYVGRDLLPDVRAADGSVRPPTGRELRRSIHRMQRRWGHWVHATARGRAVRFKRIVRRKVPRWGKQHLRSIAWCESRNNPRAIGGGGAYRGMYQFTFRTWSVVGGTGDPAAAPRHEQTWRAWLLLSRHGSGHWPVCG
jgi:Transglycosylase-like domain